MQLPGLSRGGVLVLSNVRGGSEYGPAWHRGAMKRRHQNAFDDFISISEALIDSEVTSLEKLGAIGRSPSRSSILHVSCRIERENPLEGSNRQNRYNRPAPPGPANHP